MQDQVGLPNYLGFIRCLSPPSLARSLSSWQTIRYGLSCSPELELELAHEHELELELGPHRTLCAGIYADGECLRQIRLSGWVCMRVESVCASFDVRVSLPASFLSLEPLPSPTLPRQSYIFYIK